MKLFVLAIIVLSACGRDLDRFPSADLVRAEHVAMDALRKHVGEKSYAYLSTANIEVTAVEPGVFACAESDTALGCSHFEEEGESRITVAGDPATCQFIAILSHEYEHIWLRARLEPGSHDHSNPEWAKAWMAYDEIIANAAGNCKN